MKRLILLFVLFFNTIVFAQETDYSIVVKDIETQLPVENATVAVLKTKQILASDQDGKVSFTLNGDSDVEISATDYENLTLSWESLKESEFVVYLKTKDNKLDEIVLSKENPQRILQKIVSNSAAKLATPCNLKAYVREFFILDNKYSYYNDGLVNFQFKVSQKKVNTTLLVEQNRSYSLIEQDVSADLRGYNLNDIMENYANLKYFDPILDPKAKKEYDFVTKGDSANKDYFIMTISPLDKAKKALDTFEIVYDSELKLIISFSIIITPGTIAELPENKEEGAKNITRSVVKVNYKVDDDNYYVMSSNEEVGYDVVLKDKTVKNIQVRNNLITTNFSKKEIAYDKSEVFKEESLFNKKNNILTSYWNIDGFTATEEEKTLIEGLEFRM